MVQRYQEEVARHTARTLYKELHKIKGADKDVHST